MTRQEQLNKLSKASSDYQPRKERVKSFSGNLYIWVDDNNHFKANSYDWWTFIENKNGLYIFNWYYYSSSTRKHQYEAARIMRNLGVDYITVEYRESLHRVELDDMLADKIDELYQGENALAVSRATKYAVYSEKRFNQTLADVKAIAAALKMPESTLDKMLIEAEDKANAALLNKLADDHDRRVLMRELRKQNNNLSAIQL